MHRETAFNVWFLLIIGAFSVNPAMAAPVPKADSQAAAFAKQGLAHFDKGAYQEALEVLQKSFALEKKASVMALMASCLNQLGRYDEALAMYEGALVDFPDASDKFRLKVNEEINLLRGKVGTIALQGDAPAGAMVFVGDRQRGTLPLAAPIRVSAGIHQVRVTKEGFPAITQKVEVNAGQAVVANLVAQARQGRLDIREKHNWVLHVEIDGKDVGLTPWNSFVDVGEHQIRLRGFMGVDVLAACETSTEVVETGAKMESSVETAEARLYEVTPIVLGADATDTALKVDSKPTGGDLSIDGQHVGSTPWKGRLALGEHRIEVHARGFVTATEMVSLEKRKERDLSVVLERLPAPPEYWTKNKMGAVTAFGVGAVGFGVFAIAGGMALDQRADLIAQCTDNLCSGSLKAERDRITDLGTTSLFGLIGAGAGTAVGTILWLTDKPTGTRTRVGVDFTVGGGVLCGTF